MREVKFRAWDKLEKSMANVGGVHFDGVGIEQAYMEYHNTPMNDWKWMPLDCIEVMQFTGLKDKNGKEIYEGDILSWGVNKLPVSFGWGDDNECYGSSYGWLLGSGIFGSDQTFSREVEVVGNIYENSELLKQNT